MNERLAGAEQKNMYVVRQHYTQSGRDTYALYETSAEAVKNAANSTEDLQSKPRYYEGEQTVFHVAIWLGHVFQRRAWLTRQLIDQYTANRFFLSAIYEQN